MAWMADAAEAVYRGYHYQGFENYKLFKGVVLDGSEAVDYQIDLKLLIDDGTLLRVAAKVSSLNAKGKPVFHYGAELLLSTKPLSTKSVDDNLPDLSKGTADATAEAQALYNDGTLFHGESLQGIADVMRCDQQGLLLHCQVPQIAVEKRGESPLKIFSDDLVYQAMLVWVRRQMGMGSLPSATQAWTVYGQPQIGESFYLSLAVVKETANTLIADIRLISADKQLLAEIKSAEVTASESLNTTFLKGAVKAVVKGKELKGEKQ